MRGKKSRPPTAVEAFITDNAWVLLVGVAVAAALLIGTGLAGRLYRTVLIHEPRHGARAGMIVGGMPIMGTPLVVTVMLTAMLSMGLGGILTGLGVWLYLRLTRRK